MSDTRNKNSNWCTRDASGAISQEQARLAVLMDIRDELQAINRKLDCYRIPRALDALIELGTTGAACMAEGFNCVLVEREAEYVADIRRRFESPSIVPEG